MRTLKNLSTFSSLVVAIIIGTCNMTIGSTLDDKEYNWAISAAIEENLRLESYDGYGLSVTKLLSKRYSIRLSQSININQRDTGNHESFYFRERTTIVLLGRINPESKIQCYWGLGPTGKFRYYKDKYRSYLGEETRSKKDWSIGLLGTLGVELFAKEYLGIHIEYRSTLSYGRGYENGRYTEQTFNYYLGTVFEFGVSLYF